MDAQAKVTVYLIIAKDLVMSEMYWDGPNPRLPVWKLQLQKGSMYQTLLSRVNNVCLCRYVRRRVQQRQKFSRLMHRRWRRPGYNTARFRIVCVCVCVSFLETPEGRQDVKCTTPVALMVIATTEIEVNYCVCISNSIRNVFVFQCYCVEDMFKMFERVLRNHWKVIVFMQN